MSEWRFEWLTSWDEVWDPSFVRQWEQWCQLSPTAHVFFTPPVVRAWYETYRQLRNIEPRFAIGRCGEDRMFMFPLVVDRGGIKDAWQKVLQPVGCTEFDCHDPIISGPSEVQVDPALWSAFWDECEQWAKSIDVMRIPRMRNAVPPGRGIAEIADKSPYIPLDEYDSMDEFLSSLPKQLRQELRRQPRRLGKLGTLNTRVFAANEVEAAKKMLPQFMEAHSARWPDAYKAEGFYNRLIEHALPAGILHASVLEMSGEPFSWHIGFFHNRRFYYYVPAFNGEMATYSPSKVHLKVLIEEMFNQECDVFDFLRGQEPYKLQWAKNSCPLHSLRWHANGFVPAMKRYWQGSIRPRVVAAKRSLVRCGGQGS